MIKYKIDVIQALKKAGFTNKRIREENLLSQITLTRIRRGGDVNTETINRICIMLRCQPGDILEVVPTDEEKIRFF